MIDEIYIEVPELEVLNIVTAKVKNNEKSVDAAFQSSQTKFAEYHNIELGENELQDQLDGDDY